MSVNTCLIYRCLSSASAVIRSWFIYELQKSTTIAFSRNSLYTFYSRNPTCGIHPCLRISNRKYPSLPPPMPSEFYNREPPLPFRNPKSRLWYGMDIFWNQPIPLSFNLSPSHGIRSLCKKVDAPYRQGISIKMVTAHVIFPVNISNYVNLSFTYSFSNINT